MTEQEIKAAEKIKEQFENMNPEAYPLVNAYLQGMGAGIQIQKDVEKLESA